MNDIKPKKESLVLKSTNNYFYKNKMWIFPLIKTQQEPQVNVMYINKNYWNK